MALQTRESEIYTWIFSLSLTKESEVYTIDFFFFFHIPEVYALEFHYRSLGLRHIQVVLKIMTGCWSSSRSSVLKAIIVIWLCQPIFRKHEDCFIVTVMPNTPKARYNVNRQNLTNKNLFMA